MIDMPEEQQRRQCRWGQYRVKEVTTGHWRGRKWHLGPGVLCRSLERLLFPCYVECLVEGSQGRDDSICVNFRMTAVFSSSEQRQG